MRILYAAGNRAGADVQLSRFWQHNQNKHQIKIAAYLKSSESFKHINWTLDALFNNLNRRKPSEINNIFARRNFPKVGLEEIKLLIDEIDAFDPQLVISDGEPICANIAHSFGVPLWYCSPIFLLNGIDWERYELSYISTLEKHRRLLGKYPEAEQTFIYSPFGDLENSPPLKIGFDWISPYAIQTEENIDKEDIIAVIKDKNRTEILFKLLNCLPKRVSLFSSVVKRDYNNLKIENLNRIESYKKALSRSKYFFGNGETSYLTDAIVNNIFNIGISPDLDDLETIMNALTCRAYGVGMDLNKIELMGPYALEALEKMFVDNKRKWQFKKPKALKIGEMLDEYALRI